MSDVVIFKGTKEGLTVILKEDTDFSIIKEQFENKVKSLKSFLSGSKITIKFTSELSNEQIRELVDIMKTCGEAEVLMAINEEPSLDNTDVVSKVFDGIYEGSTKFHRGTLRSGQSISYFGNVIVVGDVNSGAEIIAAGNVIVLGIVRGTIHAGVQSNNEAFIAALSLQPTQLRIGEVIARACDGEQFKGIHPEIATIKDGTICIERLHLEMGKNIWK